jgi:hypothetical protein
MSQNKFDNDIKQKLENRRITPSEDSWSILSNRLEKDKKVFPYKSLLIAASLVGVIVTILLNFNNNQTTISKFNEIKNDTIPTEKANDNTYLTTTNTKKDSTILGEKKSRKEVNKARLANSNYKTTSPNTNQKSSIKNNEQIEFDIKDSYGDKNMPTQVNSVLRKDTVIKNLNLEIETLLANAKSNILTETRLDSSKLTNYNSLLEEAEIELEIDNSLKNKIFKTVVANYNSISKSNKKEQ